MITVTQSIDGSLLYLKSHYIYSERIKSIPGAQWNPDIKMWSVPVSEIDTVNKRFSGELFYKTPEWVIKNEPMPDLSSLYSINPSITAPHLKSPFKLYDYQDFGVKFAIDRIDTFGFCIVADSVGLGKTNQGIGVILDRFYKGYDRFLIVCKKSIKTQWKEEIEKFSPIDHDRSFPIFVTGDTAAKRKKAYEAFNNNKSSILITNYQTFLSDESELSKLGFDFVLIDEAHVVSSYGTKTNSAMSRALKNKQTLFLTGTPVMSKPEQVYGIINITQPNYFGNWTAFKNKYIVEINNGNFKQTVGAKNLNELRKFIQDVMIRRTEYEVSVQLPKTVELNINCPMDNTQKKLTEQILAARDQGLQMFESYKLKWEKSKSQFDLDNMRKCDAQVKGLIAASQAAADDPRMFHKTNSKFLKSKFENIIPNSYKMSSKMETLIDKVSDILDSDDKVIIFSKFVTSAHLIGDELKKHLGINVIYYTGQEDDTSRDNNINNFKTKDEYPVLIGTEAMAEGLNLQCAKYLINFNLPDTAAIYTQRIGRVRRVGSAYNNVIVYNLITEGSKDESRWENIQNNKNLEDGLINIDEAQRQALLDAMKGE